MGFEEPRFRLIAYIVEPEFPRISYIFAYVAHQGGLVLWHGLQRPAIASKYAIGPFSYCVDGVSYSG